MNERLVNIGKNRRYERNSVEEKLLMDKTSLPKRYEYFYYLKNDPRFNNSSASLFNRNSYEEK
jgi:hypothetical protein